MFKLPSTPITRKKNSRNPSIEFLSSSISHAYQPHTARISSLPPTSNHKKPIFKWQIFPSSTRAKEILFPLNFSSFWLILFSIYLPRFKCNILLSIIPTPPPSFRIENYTKEENFSIHQFEKAKKIFKKKNRASKREKSSKSERKRKLIFFLLVLLSVNIVINEEKFFLWTFLKVKGKRKCYWSWLRDYWFSWILLTLNEINWKCLIWEGIWAHISNFIESLYKVR